jgi:type VI secretion system secreted protein VgrG
VGPPGEEIHTDEFGRVRVHFHWDRESKMDADSSCWIHVSQAWAGGGFGGVNLPRVGQEVIVDFLGGDPDRPIIVGRLYTGVQRVPYRLPENKTQSGWRSCSTNNTGGYNEIMFEDAAGNEVFFTHAERDQVMVVKHNHTTSIGHDASTFIGHNRGVFVKEDDNEFVIGHQRQFVGKDQSVWVRRSKMHVVTENLIQQTVEGFTYQKSKGPTYIESDEAIILKVGDRSSVIIRPDGIIIQGPQVLINPQEGA